MRQHRSEKVVRRKNGAEWLVETRWTLIGGPHNSRNLTFGGRYAGGDVVYEM